MEILKTLASEGKLVNAVEQQLEKKKLKGQMKKASAK
jgi:hypothetical protein